MRESDYVLSVFLDNKVMLKSFHARLQHYVNQKFPDFQAGFRKGRGTRDQNCQHAWIIEKAREFQEIHHISVSSTTLKPFTVLILANCENL